MAKSDIIASLKLNSTDYEQKLAKAKESARKFSKEGGQGLSDMVGKFKGLAVAVAGSKAAMEVFNRVVASSQTIGDSYAVTMHSVKSAVGQFTYAMANADFSRFSMGLSDVITKARDAYNALDQLGNTQISYNYLTGRNRAELRENLLKVRDTSLSKGEREGAYARAQQIYAEIRQQTETYRSQAENYVKSALADVTGLMKETISMDDLVAALRVDISADPAGARELIKQRYNEYQKEASKYGSQISLGYGGRVISATTPSDDDKRKLSELAQQNRSLLIAYQLIFKYTDEELKALVGYLNQVDNASYAIGEFSTQIREAGNALNKPIKPETVGAVVTGGITDSVDPKSVFSEYDRVNAFGRMRQRAFDVDTRSYNIPIQEVPIITDVELYPLDSMEAALPALKEIAEKSYSAADGIYSISNALGNLSGMMDDNAAKWVSWGASMLGAVGQFVQAINGGGGLSLLSPASALLSSFVGMPMGGASRNNEIRLRVQGSDLVGSINNYNSINSRRY